MEKFLNENSAEKYSYAISSEMDVRYMNKQLKDWKYYYNIYTKQKYQKTVHRSTQLQLT